MSQTAIATSLLTLLAGIGVFLIASKMMSSSLEAMSSNKMRQMFSRMSGNPWLGVGIGAGATALIQSSGATSVMVIGFVNAGVMTLRQAASIIFGANVGTTITGQIVAMGMFGGEKISTTVLFSAMAGVGAFLASFAKSEKKKMIGEIIAGFGMLFVGLSMMSNSMESFAQLDAVKMFLAGIKSSILLVIIGAILTAIVQSSSVMTSVAITMVVAGLIDLNQGIFLTMGSNVGSCVVALIAGLTSNKNAKRTSLIHLFFNIGGVVIFLILSGILRVVTGGQITLGTPFANLFPSAPQTQLAMFHTVFNLIAVLMAIPLIDKLVALVTRMVPGEDEETGTKTAELQVYYIDDHLLKTPSIAVAQAKKEIVNMAELAMQNYRRGVHMVCTTDMAEAEIFRHAEEELDYLHQQLVRFLGKLSLRKLSLHDSAYVSTAFRTVIDLERIGDYAENLTEYAEVLKAQEILFPENAVREIEGVREATEELYVETMRIYNDGDRARLAEAERIEDGIDRLTEDMTEADIQRVDQRVVSAVASTQYLELVSDMERIADHLMNVANTVTELPA